MSLAHKPQEMRRVPREEVCFRCTVSGHDFPPANGLLVNISPFGCMIRCSREVIQGMTLRFELPVAGLCTGRVVWSMGGRLGLEFDDPIDLEPYLDMLDQLRRPSDEMGIY